MLQIIDYLDAHNGSLMVIITLVYVVATIAICVANLRSAKATRDQLEESKRQYEEEHRAFVSYKLIYELRTWYGLRFTNHGKRIATNVQLRFDKDFIESLTEQGYKERLQKLGEQEFTLGIGQSYDIYLGSNKLRNRVNSTPIRGVISYKDRNCAYIDSFHIDFSKYATIFSITTDLDRMQKAEKRLIESLAGIKNELKQLNYILEHQNENPEEDMK